MAYLTKIKLNGVYYDIRDHEAYTAINILNADAETPGSVAKQIKDAVSKLNSTSFQIVDKLPTPEEAEDGVIYLVEESGGKSGSYVEYVKIKNAAGEYSLEKIGTTDVDLSGYETREDATELAKSILIANGFSVTEETIPEDGYSYITLHNNGLASEGIGTDPNDEIYKRRDLANKDDLLALQGQIGKPATESEEATGVYKYIDDVFIRQADELNKIIDEAVAQLNYQTSTSTKATIEMESETEGVVIMNDLVVLVPKESISEPDTSWYSPRKLNYTFTNVEQVKGLAKLVNDGTSNFHGVTIELTEDLDFENQEWEEIGKMSSFATGKTIYNQSTEDMGGTVFEGTFDGKGHVIKNLRLTHKPGSGVTNTGLGLFGIVRNGSTIKNITIDGLTIEGSDVMMVGGIVGYIPKESDVTTGTTTIENCHIKGLIKISGSFAVGGILGRMESGISTCVVKNCSVIGNDGSYIQATLPNTFCNTGGLVGSLYTSSDNIVEDNEVSNVTVYGKGMSLSGLVAHVEKGTFNRNKVSNVKIVNEMDVSVDMQSSVSVGALVASFDSTYRTGGTQRQVLNIDSSNVIDNVTIIIPNDYDGASIGVPVDSDGFPSWETWGPVGTYRWEDRVDPRNGITGTADFSVLKSKINFEKTR